jgi:hypothetical protein
VAGGEDGEGGTPEAGGRCDVGCGGGEDERGWEAGGMCTRIYMLLSCVGLIKFVFP